VITLVENQLHGRSQYRLALAVARAAAISNGSQGDASEGDDAVIFHSPWNALDIDRSAVSYPLVRWSPAGNFIDATISNIKDADRSRQLECHMRTGFARRFLAPIRCCRSLLCARIGDRTDAGPPCDQAERRRRAADHRRAEHFCSGGALAVVDGEAVVPVIIASRALRHVVLTQDWHPPGHGSFPVRIRGRPFDVIAMILWKQTLGGPLPAGQAGRAFHPHWRPRRAELVIPRVFAGEIDSTRRSMKTIAYATRAGGYLRERGPAADLLAGLATDFCVDYSAVDARRLGFEAVLVERMRRSIWPARSDAAWAAWPKPA